MWYTVDIYDQNGKVVKNVKLNETLFSDDIVNNSLIHEFYLLQTSNARIPIASSKTRAEVQWSGKKLYRQKGTGSARVGEKRSPVRVGWWVAFGPKSERNYKKVMNKKARKIALYWLLTLKIKDKELCGLENFDMKSPKTKEAVALLKNIGATWKKTLFVLDQKNENIAKSLRNIDNVKYLMVDYLNPEDIMKYNNIIMVESALEKINTK